MHATRSHAAHCRLRIAAGFTLVEIIISMTILTIVIVGTLGALLQSRRLTEGSIYQNAALTVVHGYLEQIKEADFANIPYYKGTTFVPSGNTDPIQGLDTSLRPYAIKTLLNNTDVDTHDETNGETISDYLLISSGNPPDLASVVAGGATPAHVRNNLKLIDVNQTTSKNDDLNLRLWVWVQDASDPTFDATQVRSITIIYHWAMNGLPQTKWFKGSVRSLRSAVPTL